MSQLTRVDFKFNNISQKFPGSVRTLGGQRDVMTATRLLTTLHRKITKVQTTDMKKLKSFLNKLLKPMIKTTHKMLTVDKLPFKANHMRLEQ